MGGEPHTLKSCSPQSTEGKEGNPHSFHVCKPAASSLNSTFWCEDFEYEILNNVQSASPLAVCQRGELLMLNSVGKLLQASGYGVSQNLCHNVTRTLEPGAQSCFCPVVLFL